MAILKHILIIGTLMFLTTGCFTNFEPDIKSTPVLCMNSTITPGDTIDVLLTRTWRWDEDTVSSKEYIINDADVKLYVNDEYKEQLSFSKLPNSNPYTSEYRQYGYRSTYIPEEGDKIKLTAHSEKYGDASAEVAVPHSIDITRVEYDHPVFDSAPEGSQKSYHFSLNLLIWFTDRPSTTDYYMFGTDVSNPKNYYIPNPDGTLGEDCYARVYYYNINYDREPLFTEHVSPLESAVSETSGYSIFSDRQISGKDYPLHISIENINYTINNPENNPELDTASINLNLDVISQSYYNHVLSVWAHNDGINGILGDVGLADPVWDGSNVSTGAGVVAAKSTSTYKIYLQNIVEKED